MAQLSLAHAGTKQRVSAVLISGLLLSGALAACSSSTTTGTSSASGSPAASNSAAQAAPNNIADKDADAILKETKAATDKATSVKVASSSQTGSEQQSFELVLTKNGATGTMSQSTGSFQLIATTDTIYIKGDGNFNTTFAGGEASKLLEGKWLAIPAGGAQAQSFKSMASTSEFFGQLLTSDRKLTKTTDTKVVDGVTCIGLTDEGKGTLWVATTGEPLPMSIDPPPGQNGSLPFTDWNASVTIEPPPADQVVDISKLPQSQGTPTP